MKRKEKQINKQTMEQQTEQNKITNSNKQILDRRTSSAVSVADSSIFRLLFSVSFSNESQLSPDAGAGPLWAVRGRAGPGRAILLWSVT